MDDDLIRQLTGTSNMGPEEARLKSQAAMVWELRNKLDAPSNATSPYSALGGLVTGIGHAVRQRAMESDLASRYAALDAKRAAALSGLPGPEADVSPNKARFLSRSLEASQDPGLMAVGKGYTGEAMAGEKEALQRMKVVGMLTQTGMKVDEAHRRYDQAFYAPKYGNSPSDANYSGVVTQVQPDNTLSVTPRGTAKPPMSMTPPNAVDPQDKRLSTFMDKYNAHIASGRNPLGVNQSLVDRAGRVKALADWTDVPNLDRREMEEMAMGVASMVQGGNVVARQTVAALVPASLKGDLNKVQEWMTNEPVGLDQQKFAKRLLKAVNREEAQGLKNVRATVRQGVPGYLDVLSKPQFSGRVNQYLREAGFGDDEIEQMLGGAPGKGAASAPAKGASNLPKATGTAPAAMSDDELIKKYTGG